MKQNDLSRAALDAALLRLGLDITEEKQNLLLKHLELVIKKNQVINLTRISNLEDAIVLHIEDSLSLIEDMRQEKATFCDLGTGAGFPGIPIGIVSGYEGILLDSVKKKALAVQEFINELNLNKQLKAKGIRSEELAVSSYKKVDYVVARAVTKLVSLLELSSPLLKVGGKLIAMKGLCSPEEEYAAREVAHLTGLHFNYKRELFIGDNKIHRSIYVFEKREKGKVKLPRQAGLATKKPLA